MTASFNIEPGGILQGRIRVPGDKSISHRAVILAALASGTSRIEGFLASADCLATLSAVEAMGAQISRHDDNSFSVTGCAGVFSAPKTVLDLGNSGTAMRLLSGALAGQAFDVTLTGDASLCSRPMNRIIEPLKLMGAKINSREGRAPLQIMATETLRGLKYTMPVASAQVKSAILLAGLAARGTTVVTERALTRDHTERMLAAMGAPLRIESNTISLDGPAKLSARDIDIPGDFSSAAFFIAIAAAMPGSEVTLEHVGLNPSRTGLLEILREMGARIEIENSAVVSGEPVGDIHVVGSRLRGIKVDPRLVPLAIDEFPVLFVAAALADGTTRVTDAAELRVKESDRIAVMAAGLSAFGVHVSESENGLSVTGGTTLTGGRVSSGGDHRIAMSLALAACGSTNKIIVDDASNVGTSYPEFAFQARSLGLRISVHPAPGEDDHV